MPAHGNLTLPLGQRQDTERWSVDSEPREGKRIVMGEKRDRDVDSLFCQVHTPLASRFSIKRIMVTSMKVWLLCTIRS